VLRNKNVFIYQCTWINPPHPKIILCICDERCWGFWFNSEARSHGIGQLPVSPEDHRAAITRDCFLDLSSVKAVRPQEVRAADDRGEISADFAAKIVEALEAGVDLLNNVHKEIALNALRA
jgi:hypothetical protein